LQQWQASYDNRTMVKCPECGGFFEPMNIVIEEFGARLAEAGKSIGPYLMFSCPECGVFLDMKEKSR